MKLYDNFFCVVDVVCDHWYLGSKHTQFVLCFDYDDLFDDSVTDYQKITDIVLDRVDKNRLFENYSIALSCFYGEKTGKVELSQQFITDWTNRHIKYIR